MTSISYIKLKQYAEVDVYVNKDVTSLASRFSNLMIDMDKQQAIEESSVDAELDRQVEVGKSVVDVLLYAVSWARWNSDSDMVLSLCESLAKYGRIDDLPFVVGVWCLNHRAWETYVLSRIPDLVMKNYILARLSIGVWQWMKWEEENPKWRDPLFEEAQNPHKFCQVVESMLALMETYQDLRMA